MNVFDSYTFSLLSEFNKQEVKYIIVGGYAVNYHGYRRTTGDIDLWIKPDNGTNKEKIISCLLSLGVEENVLGELKKMDFSVPLVFIDGEEPYKIDFLTHISGVKFDEAWEQKIMADIDGITVPFVHLNHLVISKITSERTKDKIDIEELQKISQLRKDNPK